MAITTYINNVFVGQKTVGGVPVAAIPANCQITDPTDTSTYIKEGQIVFVNEKNEVLTPTTVAKATSIRPCYFQEGTVKFGAVLNLNDAITAFSGVAYVAESYKTVQIGSATASAIALGSLVEGETYTLALKDKAPQNGDIIRGVQHPVGTKVIAGSTTLSVLYSLYSELQNNYNFGSNHFNKILRTYNTKLITATPASGVSAPVAGFKVKQLATEITKPNHGINASNVGSYICIGAFGTGSVYKIVGITPTSIKVDTPIAEATAVYPVIVFAPPTTDLTCWLSTSVLESSLMPFVPGQYEPLFPEFDMIVSPNFDATPVVVTPSCKGSGTWKQVAIAEWNDKANEGNFKRVNVEFEQNVYRKLFYVKDECYSSALMTFKGTQVADGSGNFSQIRSWAFYIPTTALYLKGASTNFVAVMQAILDRFAPNVYTTATTSL